MVTSTEELIRKIHEEEDFVNIKRFDYSLDKVQNRFPSGAPDKTIANALLLEEEDVPLIYQNIVNKLREYLKVDL